MTRAGARATYFLMMSDHIGEIFPDFEFFGVVRSPLRQVNAGPA